MLAGAESCVAAAVARGRKKFNAEWMTANSHPVRYGRVFAATLTATSRTRIRAPPTIVARQARDEFGGTGAARRKIR